MFRICLGAGLAFAFTAPLAGAGAQEALPKEYGYLLASRTSEASYFLSGIKRGAEPESVEAWVWTVTPAPLAKDGQQYDAKAQLSVLRCTANSIEAIKTEFYLAGEFLKSEELPVGPAIEVKSWSPVAPVWRAACDKPFRFEAKSVYSLEDVYNVARGK